MEERGFYFKSIRTEHGSRPVAQFVCIECGTTLDITNGGSGKDTDWFVRRAIRAGWSAHTHKRDKTHCPQCQSKATQKYLKPPVDTLPIPSRLIGPMPSLEEPPPPLTILQGGKGMKPPTAANAPLRDPTTEERMKIRQHLDSSFDDKTGAYLENMNDQEIARLCGVPWAMVSKIREAAYGPIRTDPEMVVLIRRMEKLGGEFAALKSDFDAYKRKKAIAA